MCEKDGLVYWCIFLVKMPLTRFEEFWPLPTESLPEHPFLILLSYCLSIPLFRYVFLVVIFSSRIVQFLWYLVVVCFRLTPRHLFIEFSFVVRNVLFSLYCFLLWRYLIFLLPPLFSSLFPQVVLFFFSCLNFYFLSLHLPVSFFSFIILACYRRFFLRFQSYFPSWVFFLVSFERNTVFSQTKFTAALIISFNSVILFVDI